MSNRLYSALRARYKAQIIEAEADILNFFENPVAVAEHPHIASSDGLHTAAICRFVEFNQPEEVTLVGQRYRWHLHIRHCLGQAFYTHQAINQRKF